MKRLVLLTFLAVISVLAQNPNTASWPTPVTDSTMFVATNSGHGTLNGNYTSGASSIVITGGTFVAPTIVFIDNEILHCTTATTTLLSGCTGGLEGTSAANHTSGVIAHNNISAWYSNQAAAEIKAVEADLDAQTKLSTVTFNASTMVFDWSTSSAKKVTLTAAVTAFTASNPVSGRTYTTQFCQDATGGWAVTFPGAFKNAFVSTTASVCTIQVFYYDGTNYNGGPASSSDTPTVWIGPTRSACGTPLSGNLCAWFDSTDNSIKVKDSSANVYCVVKTASSGTSNQVVDYVGSNCIPHYRALASADIPPNASNTSGTAAALAANGANCAAGQIPLGVDTAGAVESCYQLFLTNAKTATYQVLTGDFDQCKTIPVASSTFTITLVASGSQPADGKCLNIMSYSSGVVTLARSGQNINGGTASYVMQSGSALVPEWAHIVSNGTDYIITGGFTNPMTTAGDLIIAGTTGLPTRLAIGGANTVLHGGASAETFSAVVNADLNITATTCTAPKILTAISATATVTCTAPDVPQTSHSAAYTTVLADDGTQQLHPTADNNARTFTIDSNANVAYPIGATIVFVNQINTLTIAITTDTLQLAGSATTGSRTLAAGGIATAIKITSTLWFISGPGLT